MHFLQKLKTLTFTAFTVLAFSSSCLAATYYVDNVNGSDSNSGLSTSLPWKTVAKVNASKPVAGDKILFATDRTWREQLKLPTSGTSGNPITYSSYGTGEKPTISGGSYISGWTLVSGTTYRASTSLWVDRSGHARVFTGTKQLGQKSSSTLSTNEYYFQYSTSTGTSGALTSGTLYVNIGKAPGSTDIEATYRKNTLETNKHYVTIDGLHLTKSAYALSQYAAQSNGIIVRNCLIDYNTMGIYAGASTSSHASGWLIEKNTFLNNGQNTVFDQSVYIKFCDTITIQNNIFKNGGVGAYAIDVNGSSNNIIRYNYSEGNGGGFMEFYQDTAGGSKNNKIYYNVSVNDRGFIYSGGGTGHTGNEVYNNTIYGSTGYGVCVDSGTLSAFKNNIIWSSKANVKYYTVTSGASITSSSNNVIGPFGNGSTIKYQNGSYSSLAAFKSANSSLEVNSLSGDPLFVKAGTDFHLTSSSPSRSAGVNVSLTKDFDGIAFTSTKPDVGAYQYSGTNLNPPSNLTAL